MFLFLFHFIIPLFFLYHCYIRHDIACDSFNGGHSVSNELQLLNNKVDGLISQQRDGWAHDRFNALYEAIHVQGAKRGTSLVRRVARKVKSMLK